MGDMMGMSWWMLPQGLIGLVLLILLVLGTVWLLQALTTSNHSPQQTDPAQTELRRRYAAGQIDRDEYLRRLEVLTSS